MSSGDVDFLRQVPVLADLSDALLVRLANEVRNVSVRAGDWVIREGQVTETLYVIRTGRLEVISEGPPETMIRVLRRGDVLGELALLREDVHSASVRARRDSELIKLSRAQFEALVAEAPSFALGLTRSMGAQLAANRSPVFATKPPHTVAVLGLDRAAPAPEAGSILAEALRAHGSVAELRGEADRDASEMVEMLDRVEGTQDRVVLIGDATVPGQPWTDFCLREAELVIACSGGAPDRRWIENPAALHGCELVTVGGRIDESSARAIAPREIQALGAADQLDRAMEVTARRLAGRAVGLVLSGGARERSLTSASSRSSWRRGS